MRLNWVEFALMNNPIRAASQRHYEARQLLRLGGPLAGGQALEIGCGRGVGVELMLGPFAAGSAAAFDLDPRMVRRARARLTGYGRDVALWVGDATAISVPAESYDAVFDFGIIHHISDWRAAVAEVFRVLKPAGRFYAEEVMGPFLDHPLSRRLFDHPQQDRFGLAEFSQAVTTAGFDLMGTAQLWGAFAWLVARKPE